MTAALEAVEVSPTTVVATAVALSFVGGAVAAAVAFLHRIYSREPSPSPLNVLSGLGAVALWLNLSGALGNFVGGESVLISPGSIVVNLVSIGAGGVASVYGARLGDKAAVELSSLPESYEGDVRHLVRSAGRNVTVRMPEEDYIEDIDGYDPVSDETKEDIARKEFVFPRGITVDELLSRVSDRLKEDHEVGYVDIELDDRGEVGFLSLGRSLSGIGPTLAPGTCAVAIRADPANVSSPGDTVQIMRKKEDGTAERVATGELRGTSEETVTVALDKEDAKDTEPSTRYRLVTLPSEKGPEREFAAMLRSADETMSVTEVSEGSPFVGERFDELGVSIVAVEPAGGETEAVPEKTRTVSAGDTLYAVGRPDELRRISE